MANGGRTVLYRQLAQRAAKGLKAAGFRVDVPEVLTGALVAESEAPSGNSSIPRPSDADRPRGGGKAIVYFAKRHGIMSHEAATGGVA